MSVRLKKIASSRMLSAVCLPTLIIALSLMMVLLVSDCGNSSAEAVLPAKAQIDTIADASILSAGAAIESGELLTADDLRTRPGSSLVFAANSTRSPVRVDFDLEGPWDLSRGPDTLTLTLEQVDTASAPGDEYFKGAGFAVRSSWDPPLIEEKYIFEKDTGRTLLVFGESGEARHTVYSQPSRALILPAAVGDQWLDSYQKTGDGETVTISAENRIVSYNTLEVPAGEFDAFLLQTRVTATNEDGDSTTTWDYVWLVPGVGRAAEIISMPGEKEEVFKNAWAVYRLLSQNG
jgi:hypothetical protein